jgi:uncharacterized protein
MEIKKLLFDEAGRLRSGWRFLVFAVGFIGTTVVAGALVIGSFTILGIEPNTLGPASFVLGSLSSLVSALLIGWLCGKYFEGLPFRALGAWFTKGWLWNFLAGILLGTATFALAAGFGSLFGRLGFSLNVASSTTAILSTLAISFVIFSVAAAFEEALFRGYIFQTFVRSELVVFAIVFTSLLFATVHNANPSATTLSWVNTFIAGIWFAVAYLKTRDLWLAFGLHLAWNWTQGSIFGVEVSGLTEIVKDPLMREADGGPAWITGGEYGIEGGIVTTIALLVSTAVVYLLPFQKNADHRRQNRER